MSWLSNYYRSTSHVGDFMREHGYKLYSIKLCQGKDAHTVIHFYSNNTKTAIKAAAVAIRKKNGGYTDSNDATKNAYEILDSHAIEYYTLKEGHGDYL